MIQIPEPLLEAIRRHGRESYRDEACGVLFGSQTGSEHGVKEVQHVQPLANSRDGERHRRFLITPKDYQRAEAEATARGLTLLGFYHSHPDHPAFPSGYDLDHGFPFFSYVIVSVQKGEPTEVRSFVMKEDRSAFDTEELRTA
ncbi:MAG TPA: M67 family metallopeptidase [Vicinamibacteria bacterium]|nr:M67 family metallopeptidase [Vicinamibacteria bacterium]